MRFPLALLAALLPLTAAAELYRWKDARGQVHYTQTPPPGMQAYKLESAPPPPANTPVEKLREYNAARDKAAAEKAKKDAEAAAQKTERDLACSEAQRRISFLNNHPPQRITRKDAEGNTVRMSPEDHAQALQRARDSAAKNCS